MSAVKRVEKLLHLSDKRLVQSATTLAKQKQQTGFKRKRSSNAIGGNEDEILGIAREAARQKAEQGGDGEAREEVVLKGTGKAIQEVMELGLWFQQREEYDVRLKTGTVGAVDDIELEETNMQTEGMDGVQMEGGAVDESADTDAQAADPAPGAKQQDATELSRQEKAAVDKAADADQAMKPQDSVDAVTKVDEVLETRIRYTSVLEVYVSLK